MNKPIPFNSKNKEMSSILPKSIVRISHHTMPYKMGVALALMCVWFANFSSYKSELLCSGWSTTSGVSQFFKFGSAIAWLDAKTAVVNLKATPFSLSMKTILTLNSTKRFQAEQQKKPHHLPSENGILPSHTIAGWWFIPQNTNYLAWHPSSGAWKGENLKAEVN